MPEFLSFNRIFRALLYVRVRACANGFFQMKILAEFLRLESTRY